MIRNSGLVDRFWEIYYSVRSWWIERPLRRAERRHD